MSKIDLPEYCNPYTGEVDVVGDPNCDHDWKKTEDCTVVSFACQKCGRVVTYEVYD